MALVFSPKRKVTATQSKSSKASEAAAAAQKDKRLSTIARVAIRARMRVQLLRRPRMRSQGMAKRISVPKIFAAAVIDDDLNRGAAVPLVRVIIDFDGLTDVRVRLGLGKSRLCQPLAELLGPLSKLEGITFVNLFLGFFGFAL